MEIDSTNSSETNEATESPEGSSSDHASLPEASNSTTGAAELDSNTESSDDETELEDEFEVEKILDVVDCFAGRKFQVKWEGYRRPTWDDDGMLIKCSKKLDDFWRRWGDKPVPAVGGADEADIVDINLSNWSSVDEVIERACKLSAETYANATIDIVRLGEQVDKDHISVLLHSGHFYVSLHLVKERLIYLSDSNNIFMREGWLRKEVRTKLVGKRRIRIIPI